MAKESESLCLLSVSLPERILAVFAVCLDAAVVVFVVVGVIPMNVSQSLTKECIVLYACTMFFLVSVSADGSRQARLLVV